MDRAIKNFERFQKYTFKLFVIFLVIGIISFVLFKAYPIIYSLSFITSISALMSHTILKILIYTLKEDE